MYQTCVQFVSKMYISDSFEQPTHTVVYINVNCFVVGVKIFATVWLTILSLTYLIFSPYDSVLEQIKV